MYPIKLLSYQVESKQLTMINIKAKTKNIKNIDYKVVEIGFKSKNTNKPEYMAILYRTIVEFMENENVSLNDILKHIKQDFKESDK